MIHETLRQRNKNKQNKKILSARKITRRSTSRGGNGNGGNLVVNRLSKLDRLVFYDDDLDGNILPFRQELPLVKAIHVPDNKPYHQILHGYNAFYYPHMFLKLYPTNRFAQIQDNEIRHIHAKASASSASSSTHLRECRNDTAQGLTEATIENIKIWATTNTSPNSTILFDWDKTLSVMNGLNLAALSGGSGAATPLEAAHYYTGLRSRFDALQSMFALLKRQNITCFIFTNNPYGHDTKSNHERFLTFLKMVQVLCPTIVADDIFYGHQDKVKTFKRNKRLMEIYNL